MPNPKHLLACAAWVALSATGGQADACPSCPTQREARYEVYEQEPWRWLLIALTPFALIAGTATASYRIGLQKGAAEREGSR